MKRILFCFLLVSIISCKTGNVYMSAGAPQALAAHTRVAILPFKVNFSEEYKNISQQGNRQGDWQNQERIAGLDLQKSAFTILTKRAAKKAYNFTVVDFLSTNKALEREGIRFSQIAGYDKAKLARIIGVDAVIYGEAQMTMSMRSFAARNGINCELYLYDAMSNELLWKDKIFEDVSRMGDSPQTLANSALRGLINSIPYVRGR